jgi:hypothetical protein
MVLHNVNLNKLLKVDLSYCEISHIKTSLYYLGHL